MIFDMCCGERLVFCQLRDQDGVPYGTVVTSYGTVPEPQLARLF